MTLRCGYCHGEVSRGERGGYIHNESGERITNITPGDFVSAGHNRAGTVARSAEVYDDENEEE